ncbi:MAG: hypothetical protein AB7G24_04310 [Novosphingobium sp.]
MIRNRHFLLMALLLLASMGCTDSDSQKQPLSAAEEAQLSVQAQAGDTEAANKLELSQKMRAATTEDVAVDAPDFSDGWQWSPEELNELTKHAEAGDISAADRLLQYYYVHEDQAKIDYWEDWLFKRGDPRAIRHRAHRLYSASKERPHNDPRKLVELREAERLVRSTTADGDENLFLERIRSEIVAIEGSQ